MVHSDRVRGDWVAVLARVEGRRRTERDAAELSTPAPESTAERAMLVGFLVALERPPASVVHQTPAQSASKRPPIVAATLTLITDHLDSPTTVCTLAQRLRCHPVYLGREFKRSEGIELSSYIRHVHVGAALAHLVKSDAKIVTLHSSTGFGSKASLFRAVSRLTGHQPGYWRRLAAQSEETTPDVDHQASSTSAGVAVLGARQLA